MLKLRRVLLLALFLSGFAALVYEVVWTQLLTLAFGASTYAFSMMLAAFFVGLGLGGFVGGKYIGERDPIKIFAFLEVGIGLSGLFVLLFFDGIEAPLRMLFRMSGSFYVFMISIFLLSFLFMLLPATLMGATLPTVSKIYVNERNSVGRDIGTIYSFNTFGAIFGSFAAGFILLPLIGLVNTAIIAALINIVAALLLFHFSTKESKLRFYTFILGTVLLVVYISSLSLQPMVSGFYDLRNDPGGEIKKHSGEANILYYGSNAYGTTVVTDIGTDRSLWINNKVDASNTPDDMSTQILLGYLPMLANPHAKKVLNIGLGGGFTLGAIEAFDASTIDVIELNPLVKEATSRYFKQFNGNSLEDSRINLTIADARNYLLTSDEKYDVIVSEPSNLWVSGESSLFTKEFYIIVREHLNEKGVFSQWIPLYDFGEEDTKIFLNTINEVFPHVTLWISGTDGIIISSNEPVTLDHEYIVKMLNQSQRIRKDLMSMNEGFIDTTDEYKEVIPEIDLPDVIIKLFALSDEDIRIYANNTPFHTDDNPVLEFNAARNLLFLEDKYSSTAEIKDYIQKKNKDLKESIIPITNTEHQVGDWLYLDFLGIKIKMANWSSNSSGYRIEDLVSSAPDKSRYYKYASFTGDRSFFDVSTERSKLKTFKIDSKDVVYVKNIQRQAEVKELLLKKFPRSKIIEFKKNGHNAYKVEYANGQGMNALIGWYCDVNNVIYLVDVNAYDDVELSRIDNGILCLHESNQGTYGYT